MTRIGHALHGCLRLPVRARVASVKSACLTSCHTRPARSTPPARQGRAWPGVQGTGSREGRGGREPRVYTSAAHGGVPAWPRTDGFLAGWLVDLANWNTPKKNANPPSQPSRPLTREMCGASRSSAVSGATPSFQISSCCSGSCSARGGEGAGVAQARLGDLGVRCDEAARCVSGPAGVAGRAPACWAAAADGTAAPACGRARRRRASAAGRRPQHGRGRAPPATPFAASCRQSTAAALSQNVAL